MRDPQTKTINGHEWEASPWPGMHGLKMQARLARVIAPVLGALPDDKKSKGEKNADALDRLMDMDVGRMTEALMQAIDPEATPKLIRDMLNGAAVEGRDITNDRVFNEHFSANFAELYQGLAFILSVNFGDFRELAGRIGGLIPSAKGKSPSEYREDSTEK